jgi:hypothetical protein
MPVANLEDHWKSSGRASKSGAEISAEQSLAEQSPAQ